MAMMPGAKNKLLANQSRQGRMKSYQGVCLHTMVGSLSGTNSMFQKNGTAGTESHFGVGADGTIYQWVDTAYTADANYLGSGHVISIETEDYGGVFGRWNTSGDNVPAWTDAQIEACAKIIAWAHKTHGIPVTQMKTVKDRGVGYHAMGVPNNGLPNSLKGTRYQWSKYAGKVCPGKKRIAQVPQVVKRAQALAGGASSPAPTSEKEGDFLDMAEAIYGHYAKDQTVKAKTTGVLRVNDKGQHIIAPINRGGKVAGSVTAAVFGLKDGEAAEFRIVVRDWKTGKVYTKHGRQIVVGRHNNGWPVSLDIPIYDQTKFATSSDIQYQLQVTNTTNHAITVNDVQVHAFYTK